MELLINFLSFRHEGLNIEVYRIKNIVALFSDVNYTVHAGDHRVGRVLSFFSSVGIGTPPPP
jgi:hypothetical protein